MDLVHPQMIVSVFVTLPNTGTGYQTFVVQSYIDNQDHSLLTLRDFYICEYDYTITKVPLRLCPYVQM